MDFGLAALIASSTNLSATGERSPMLFGECENSCCEFRPRPYVIDETDAVRFVWLVFGRQSLSIHMPIQLESDWEVAGSHRSTARINTAFGGSNRVG